MNKLVKNYLMYLFYEVVALIVPLFTAPYLTRILHSDNFGIYSYVYSATSLICTVSLIGLNSYGSRQTAYDRDDKNNLNEMFWELLIIRLFCGVVGTIIYFVYASISGYSAYFLMFYAYYLANVIDLSWIFVGMENMFPCVLKNTLSKLVMFLGVFVLVKNEGDVGKYLLLVSISTLLANCSLILQIKKYVSRPKVIWNRLPKHLVQSFALCAPTIVAQIYLQVDKVMIEGLSSSISQVSFYDQAEKIIMIPLSVITSLSAVMMPRIANEFAKNNGKDEIERHLVLAGQYSMFMACPMMFGMMAVAQQFIPWYLGAEYYPTATALIILSPILILNSLAGISGSQYLIATNQMKVLLFSSIGAAFLNVICNALLIPKLDCIGAAIATVVANLISVIVQYSVMCKQINMKPVFVSSIRYFVVAFCMGAIIRVTTVVCGLTASVVSTVIQVIIGVVVYFLVMMILRDEVLIKGVDMIINKAKRK